ncbi:MAG TPA: (Fe-S)-binding protein [Myxococcales bacterium]|nr:hypothetical protein [Myxococcales bacterium]HAN30994.1 (Fe-S)-binding protein [Myxococcales bacterium]
MENAILDYGYRTLYGIVLLGGGLGIFARIMYVRTRLLLAGKAEKRWDLVMVRAKRLLAIGIGQKKMFKEPASGIMHAFTFWGFCVLSIRTTLLFVNAFAPDFFLPGFLHPLYDFSKDITELLVLLMVCGFIYRRVVVQPARIHYSTEALVILSFIGGLMLTDFLYDGLHYGGMAAAASQAGQSALADHYLSFIAHAPIGSALASYFAQSSFDPATMQWIGEANYWVHLCIILTFLNLLPISKHFHVITALPNVFLSRLEPKGALALIDNIEERIINEESLGLGRVEDLSWKQTLDLYTCTECGRCTVNCPAWNTDKPLNPALIIKDLQSHLYDEKDRILSGGEAAKSEEGAIPPLIAGVNPDAIWACTTCRSCSEQCPVMIEHVDKIVDMRRHMMLNLNQFPAELKLTLKNLENKSNPWGISSAKRSAWAKGRDDVLELKKNPDAEWLYFVGCAGSYDDRAKKITDAVVKVLNAAEVSFAIIGKREKCSGDPARRMGHEYLFQEQAMANIEQMNKAGVKKVIASCPHCFNTIKNEYPQLGGKYEVVHHSQVIWRLVSEGKLNLAQASEMRITFHDSCYLGRYNDEYDAPRETLKSIPGIELVEMERSKQLGMCCGAGGARMYMEEQIGTRVNQLRVDQAMETKPEAVAVSCPFCLTMIRDGLKEKEIEGVQTLDIAEIVADALVVPEPPAEPEQAPAAEEPEPTQAPMPA